MKIVLFFSMMICSQVLNAQVDTPPVTEPNEYNFQDQARLFLKKSELLKSLENSVTKDAMPTLGDSRLLAVLPQDRMPCIIPDMKMFTMPNAAQNIPSRLYGAGAIPNPAPPLILPNKKNTR